MQVQGDSGGSWWKRTKGRSPAWPALVSGMRIRLLSKFFGMYGNYISYSPRKSAYRPRLLAKFGPNKLQGWSKSLIVDIHPLRITIARCWERISAPGRRRTSLLLQSYNDLAIPEVKHSTLLMFRKKIFSNPRNAASVFEASSSTLPKAPTGQIGIDFAQWFVPCQSTLILRLIITAHAAFQLEIPPTNHKRLLLVPRCSAASAFAIATPGIPTVTESGRPHGT